MNANSENHQPTNVDDLVDRLLERGLAEVVGGETPPDMSDAILAVKRPSSRVAEKGLLNSRSRKRRWLALAVAAALVLAAVPLLRPAVVETRERMAQNLPPAAANNRRELSDLDQLVQAGPSADPESRRLLPDIRVGEHWAARNPTTTDRIAPVAESRGNPPEDRFILGPEVAQPINLAAPVAGSGVVAATDGPPPPNEQDALLRRKVAELGGNRVWNGRHGLDINGDGDLDGEGTTSLFLDSGQWETTKKAETSAFVNGTNRGVAFDESSALGGRGDKEIGRLLRTPMFGGKSARPEKMTPEGTGPGLSGDQYVRIVENPFIKADGPDAFSTFSIDVDTASYTNVRRFLLTENSLPPPDAVRIEELVNYFQYEYAPPAAPVAKTPAEGDERPQAASDSTAAPFAAHIEVAGCPWEPEHRLVRIGVKGQEMDRRERPKSNLVFLVDVSGSMNEPNKLPLVVEGLKELTRELGENDRVAIVVYAQQEGLVLPSTSGSDQATILTVLNNLRAGGSTAGGAGLQLAYQIAEDHFIHGGTNRVILCTDGDFNVGVTSTAELEQLVEQKAKDTKVFLSVLGFGRGNLNDQMMEAVSNRGNGNFSYIDGLREARRVFVEQMTGTLVTIAKDVKIQVEFNPKQVAGYRLLGYENRMLRTEDFNDDKKDAGEIGAGHTVTALYEVVPAGKPVDLPPVDESRYQKSVDSTAEQTSDVAAGDVSKELLTLKMKYKRPDADQSEDALEWAVTDDGKAFSAASTDFQFASAVAGFGMLLRDSQHKGNLTYAAAAELAQGGVGSDEAGYRRELVEMVRRAKQLRGE
jgi:Ca-activated chloride channel family protein